MTPWMVGGVRGSRKTACTPVLTKNFGILELGLCFESSELRSQMIYANLILYCDTTEYSCTFKPS